MVVAWLLRRLGCTFHHLEGAHKVSLIGKRTGCHDTTLGHQRRLRRGLAHLAPEQIDLVIAPERAVAVGQHGQVLKRSTQLTGQLEFGSGLAPLPHSIQSKPGDFVAECEIGKIAKHWLHHSLRVGEPATIERIGRGGKTLLIPGLPSSWSRIGEILCHFWSEVGAHTSTRRGTLVLRSPGCSLFGLGANAALVDPLLALPRRRRGPLDLLARRPSTTHFLGTTLGFCGRRQAARSHTVATNAASGTAVGAVCRAALPATVIAAATGIVAVAGRTADSPATSRPPGPRTTTSPGPTTVVYPAIGTRTVSATLTGAERTAVAAATNRPVRPIGGAVAARR